MRMTPQTRVDMPIIIIMVVMVLVVTLVTARYARAQGEITCEHVKQASLITGHSSPRLIARALGLKLTEAQIAEAAKCLPSPRSAEK